MTFWKHDYPTFLPKIATIRGLFMNILQSAAIDVRKNAYAPYSNFKVGAAIRSSSGTVYVGCNVENVAFPEGTCAEAGAIAAMVAAGDYVITEAYVIAGSPMPVTPCGGCRQKLAEFGSNDIRITMATLNGIEHTMTLAELLPGAFTQDFFEAKT
jgi:cytidine deaminase